MYGATFSNRLFWFRNRINVYNVFSIYKQIESNVYFEYEGLPHGTVSTFSYCRYLNLFAPALALMYDENGINVGYKMVEEIKGNNTEKIKQINTFTTVGEYPDAVTKTYCFVSGGHTIIF